jgi:hypothetical protein
MPSGKLYIECGPLKFKGEGDEKWLSSQMEKVLSKADSLASSPISSMSSTGQGTPVKHVHGGHGSQKPLASFLNDHKVGTKQVQKFLATAQWLHQKGQQRMTSADVVKALKDSNQSRLGNAPDCLNQNVSKGFCEKDGSGFFCYG